MKVANDVRVLRYDATDGGAITNPLGAGDVAVWIVRECGFATSDAHERWGTLLSRDEKLRAERFRHAADRHAFVAAHGLLRLALAVYGAADPRAWRFVVGAAGRPRLDPESRLHFSLSHERGLVACAIALDRDVGVDAEDTSRGAPLEAADAFFSAREARELRAASLDEAKTRFFEYWTLKEAYLKARGVGITRLEEVSFRLDSRSVWRIELAPACGDDPARWQFHTWRVCQHQLALAVCQDVLEMDENASRPRARDAPPRLEGGIS